MDPNGIENYEPVIITATHYDQLATREFPKLLTGYSDNELPYVCSVYDLESIVEVLSAERLVDYINARRTEIVKGRAHGAGDEVDFLEAYLAGVLRTSSLPIPSTEESEQAGVSIIRRITNLDSGAGEILAEKYGVQVKFDPTAY
ncbi:hypothetical protein [Halorubrum sp. CSM-61]|uniref:hypothetical protein n=1 Tax=Halorubrum sp. CSM-61 TaxID=2485838 RepID=UPI000F4BD85A|nr:hypothetical protein [Halorubrum sp. CSM-61]